MDETTRKRQPRLSAAKWIIAIWTLTLLAAIAHAQTLRVVNAASFSSDSVSPGSIITIFGSNLSTTTAAVSNPAAPPVTLGGTSVTIGGAGATLFYVSPVQINAVVPGTAPAGMDAVIVTTASGTVSGTVTVSTTAAPGLFSLVGAGIHSGAIVNALTGRVGAFSVSTATSSAFLSLYLTGGSFAVTPVVSIAGVSVPVTFAGPSPCCSGLEQINISLPASLAGAGRVPVMVTAGGQLSNVVEIVLLPAAGEGEFDNDQDNVTRNRELSSIATIPGTSLALVADENDDVIREISVSQKTVIHTIALPSGAMPSAIAVNATGTLALVAERGRGVLALIDLSSLMVVSEVTVGMGPIGISISGNSAVVVNGDNDTVSIVNLTTKAVTATLTVGSNPRGVAIDATGNVYVTNENDGTISVISLATGQVTSTLSLGAVRPAAIELIAGTSFAVVADPATSAAGKVLVVNLLTGASTQFSVNPVSSGASADVVVIGSTAWIANQAAGTISILPLSITGTTVTGAPTTITIGAGVRALAYDAKDGLLLALDECSGKVTLISVPSGTVTGTINAVIGEDGDDGQDDHSDHDNSPNMPHLSSLTPFKGTQGSTVTVTAIGTNLQGATAIMFSGDPGVTASNIVVNSGGTQLTATVTVTASAKPGARMVEIVTPNGNTVNPVPFVVNP